MEVLPRPRKRTIVEKSPAPPRQHLEWTVWDLLCCAVLCCAVLCCRVLAAFAAAAPSDANACWLVSPISFTPICQINSCTAQNTRQNAHEPSNTQAQHTIDLSTPPPPLVPAKHGVEFEPPRLFASEAPGAQPHGSNASRIHVVARELLVRAAQATPVYLAPTVPRVPPQPSPKLRCMHTQSGIFSPPA
jgi:hypothetical protein